MFLLSGPKAGTSSSQTGVYSVFFAGRFCDVWLGYASTPYGGLIDDFEAEDLAPPPAQPRKSPIVKMRNPPRADPSGSDDMLYAFTSTLQAETGCSRKERGKGQDDTDDSDSSDEDASSNAADENMPQSQVR